MTENQNDSSDPQATRDLFGIPYEKAVLRREWRAMVEKIAALEAGLPPKPFPAPGMWFSVDILGNPMREYAPGKWESAKWPSDSEGVTFLPSRLICSEADEDEHPEAHAWRLQFADGWNACIDTATGNKVEHFPGGDIGVGSYADTVRFAEESPNTPQPIKHAVAMLHRPANGDACTVRVLDPYAIEPGQNAKLYMGES
jgi:hypothetical protein